MKIAYGKSCNAKVWKNSTIDWSDLCTKLQTTVRTSETVAEYQKMSKPDKKKAKDRGGFVGGFLQDGRRGKENVKSRSMLTLDNDNAEPGFIERFGSECEYAAVLYTTHGHTSENPRVRIIVPLAEDISPDAFVAAARYFAARWGINQFDECSYKVNQLMYWPSTPVDGEYICKVVEGQYIPSRLMVNFYSAFWRALRKRKAAVSPRMPNGRSGRNSSEGSNGMSQLTVIVGTEKPSLSVRRRQRLSVSYSITS